MLLWQPANVPTAKPVIRMSLRAAAQRRATSISNIVFRRFGSGSTKRGGSPASPRLSRRNDVKPEVEGIEAGNHFLKLRLVTLDLHIALADRVLDRGLLQHDVVQRV